MKPQSSDTKLRLRLATDTQKHQQIESSLVYKLKVIHVCTFDVTRKNDPQKGLQRSGISLPVRSTTEHNLKLPWLQDRCNLINILM